jgi:hypothetical protein
MPLVYDASMTTSLLLLVLTQSVVAESSGVAKYPNRKS